MAAKGRGSETDKYIAHFKEWDKNGDGFLTMQEVHQMFRASGSKLTDSQIADFFVLCDGAKGDRRLTLDEFMKGLEKINNFLSKLKVLFQQFDTDGSGYLDRAELTKLLESSGQNFTECEITQILTDADNNGDNQISFNELVDACS